MIFVARSSRAFSCYFVCFHILLLSKRAPSHAHTHTLDIIWGCGNGARDEIVTHGELHHQLPIESPAPSTADLASIGRRRTLAGRPRGFDLAKSAQTHHTHTHTLTHTRTRRGLRSPCPLLLPPSNYLFHRPNLLPTV